MISPRLFRAPYDPVTARNPYFWHQKSHEDLEYFQKYWGFFCVPARDHLQKVSWTCGETSKSTYPCSVKAISQTSNTSFSVFRKSWELRLRWWIDRGSKLWCVDTGRVWKLWLDCFRRRQEKWWRIIEVQRPEICLLFWWWLEILPLHFRDELCNKNTGDLWDGFRDELLRDRTGKHMT